MALHSVEFEPKSCALGAAGWVPLGGRNAASGNLILITFEGIIIESMRNRHTAAVCVLGLLSGAGVLVGAWWALGGWPAFAANVDPRC